MRSRPVPFHKDAIHSSLIWTGKDKNRCPKLLIWQRPSEYRPSDYLNPTLPGGGFPGFSPQYLRRIQGTSNLTALDESGWSRYAPDRDRENTQLVDTCGLQAKLDAGLFTKENIVDLTDADLAVPGDYMLFVVNHAGVPSAGQQVMLELDEQSDEVEHD